MKQTLTMCLLFFCIVVYGQQQTKTSQYEDIPFTGNETWNVSGATYQIEGTSIVGRSLFVVKVVTQDEPTKALEPQAKEIAMYAIKTDKYINSGLVSIADALVNLNPSIGIAFIKKDSNGFVNSAHGYQFHFLVSELVHDSNAHSPDTTFVSDDLEKFMSNFKEKYNSDQFEDLYSTFSDDYRNQISLETFKESMARNKKLFSAVSDFKYMYSIYLGAKGGIDGYAVYFHSTLNSATLQFHEGYLKLIFINNAGTYEYMGGNWLLAK